MDDERTALTLTQIRQAGLDDWRVVAGDLLARFRTGDFATGLALVNRIGEAAERANHHPDIALSYPEVRVSLHSHDVDALTSRDVELARQISAFAAEAGATADTAGLTVVELGLDTSALDSEKPFYAALLNAEPFDSDVKDASGQAPNVWFQGPSDDGPHLPDPRVEQRWHLDVWVPEDDVQRRIAAVLDAGGTMVSEAAAPSFWVVEDPDGNRACICADTGR